MSTLAVLVIAIGLSLLGAICPHRARLDAWSRRTRTMSQAAQLIGLPAPADHAAARAAERRSGPMLVIATINLALAIITEATLSFLGVGMPPTPALARHADPHRQQLSVLRRMVDRRSSPRSRWRC